MAVFKRKYTTKSGKAKATQKYSLDFRDHDGVMRRVAAFTDRAATLELERQLKRLVALRMAGAAPDAELSRFLESCPGELRESLGKWGVIAGERAAAGKTLAAHLEDWRQDMIADGITRKQIVGNVNKVAAIAKECGWRMISDMSATDMNVWRNNRKKAGKAAQTLNHYLVVANAFCHWLMEKKRLMENPLAGLSKLNAAADRRLERRAFTVEELGKILTAAESGAETHGMLGQLRALLYRTAVETGLRWSELKSLTRASFDFETTPATVTIRAKDAKNGMDDTLTLRPELADALKAHTAFHLPGAKTFPGMGSRGGAEMLRVDLEAAGVPYIDEYGRQGDFHAFRGTFATLGAKAGIPLAVMQRLMRHSTPVLTSNFYSFILSTDKAEALAKLPTIEALPIESQEAVKTGTDGKIIVTPVDSFHMDAMANIKTYEDTREGVFQSGSKNPETQNPPVAQGESNGGERGIRTPAGLPQSGFQDRPPKTTTNYDKSSYGKLHEPLSCQLTVSHDKPSINPPQDNAPVPSDLAPIAAAWPSIPDQIKAAVKAVLAPYLTTEGGE